LDNRAIRETPYGNKAGIFLGVMLIASGIMMLLTRFTVVDLFGYELKVEDNAFGVASRILLLIGGATILYMNKRGNYFAVGVYAFTLGTSRVIRSLPNLLSENNTLYYTTLIMLIVGINLTITGYNHLTVRMKNPLMMRYTTIAIICAYAIILLYFAYIQESPGLLISYVPDTIWYIPLYVALLIVLFSKGVVNNSPLGRVNGFTASLADRTYLGDEIIISDEDAKRIKEGFSEPVTWKEKNVGDYRAVEENVIFKTGRGDRDVVLEKWDGDDGLYLTVIDDRRDSFVDGCRMRLSSYTESENILELKDEIGVCARLLIRGSERWI
jgi:hypothetical protein